VPEVDTYSRTLLKEKVTSNFMDPITLDAGENTIEITPPLPTSPGLYIFALTLTSSQKTISNSAYAEHFVYGKMGEILNLVLDKDKYSEGETARLLFFWEGLSNMGEQLEPIAKVTINGREGPCTSLKSFPLNDSVVTLDLDITADCEDPEASLILLDGDEELDSKNFGVSSVSESEPPPSDIPTPQAEEEMDIMPIAVIVVILALIIFIYLRRR
jgi:hypothetical protein